MQPIYPTKQQLGFLSWEMGIFFHFGIRTFYEGHRDWDGREMPLSGFNPTALDCDNWILAAKEAGLTYAILVCKHHDGFANWPSKYTDYSVKNTPWKGGQGDVVREFVDACRRHGLKVGLYYSPAEAGYQQRTPKEHDDYFINQIGELLQNYGKVDYLWFDGCGSEGHEYDKARIVRAIRGFQPEILIFNMWDPDTRWIGNEEGIAGVANSNICADVDFSVLQDEKEQLDTARFLPAECDFRMRDRNWFYSEYDVHTVKSVDELVALYYHSVGNSANFLVNIGPDRRGLLPDVDAQRLREFGRAIRERFANPIPGTVSHTGTGIQIAFDGDVPVNHVILSEDLTKGEHVQSFTVWAHSRRFSPEKPVAVYCGQFIGHKRIVTFPAVRANRLAVQITGHDGTFRLLSVQALCV